jgi:hypothetical protein
MPFCGTSRRVRPRCSPALPPGAAPTAIRSLPVYQVDGRFVLFGSDAGDLVTGDTNEAGDVFLFDRDTGTVAILSGNFEEGGEAAQITGNGRFVLFESAVAGLLLLDTNDAPDLFLFDREAGETRLVSVNWANTASGKAELRFGPGQFQGTVSEDGRYVAFLSLAIDLFQPGFPTNVARQLYLRDTVARTNYWISQSSGQPVGGNISEPALSRDGSRLAFLATRLPSSPMVKISEHECGRTQNRL